MIHKCRPLAVLAGAALLAFASSPALAQLAHPRDEEACLNVLKEAKAKEQSGELQAARVLLRQCAQNPCSGFVRQQCANRNTKLEMDTPSVVLLVTDAAGGSRTDVQVKVDGEPFASTLDGRALAIDPGMHDFSFIADGHVFATQRILIVQGQRNRFITANIGRPGSRGAVAADESAGPASEEQAAKLPVARPRAKVAEAAKPEAEPEATAESTGAESTSQEAAAPKHHRILPWVLTGVGIASLGAGAVLTTWGRKDNNNLSACAPNCSDATLSHIKSIYKGADIAIGVGVAALAAAYWSYAFSQGSPGESKSSETALRLDVAPTTSGGFAAVSGRF
jgi:murein DD-endopeptidase MepM/ murein hydrolase activator NlpD